MARKRFIWKLYPTYLAVIFVSTVFLGIYALEAARSFSYEEAARDLEARAYLVRDQVAGYLSRGDLAGLEAMCKSLGGESSTRITVVSAAGVVICDSQAEPRAMSNHGDRPEIRDALSGQVAVKKHHSYALDEEMLYVAVPVEESGRIIGALRTARPLGDIEAALAPLRKQITAAATILAVAAALAGLILSRRLTRPLAEMRVGAERFAGGELGHKIAVPDSQEIGLLAEALNRMAAQLDDRIRATVRQSTELQAVLSGIAEGVMAVDADERIITLNAAATALFGMTAGEAEGRSLQEVVRNAELQRLVAEVLAEGRDARREIVMREAASERLIEARATVLKDASGRHIGALVVLDDVTQLRRLENLRRDFVANVSHELKTPVTSIKGFVETLEEGAVDEPEEARRFLDIIGKQADRLGALVDDLLALSRIEKEGERGEIALEETEVSDVIGSAVRLSEEKAAARNIRIEVSCDAATKARLNPLLMEQAIVNLIDNAIKYSEPESVVSIDAKLGESETTISVRDHGCGIAAEHLPRLFERFYRVDKARSRALGGTGLGLAIVKHIVIAHGGTVTVESTVGAGSTFTIHLPSAAAAKERQA